MLDLTELTDEPGWILERAFEINNHGQIVGNGRLFGNKHAFLITPVGLPAREWLGPNSFTGIYAFGDSLTDTGNLFALTGFPPKPYFEGRFSNGIVWIEHLAMAMQLDSDSLVNYAFAGATTGRDNEFDVPGVVEFPGLQDELDSFEADLGGNSADPTALYVVWAGASDIFVSGPSKETIATAVENTVIAVERLHDVGAPRIMVINLPDLGLTPYGLS